MKTTNNITTNIRNNENLYKIFEADTQSINVLHSPFKTFQSKKQKFIPCSFRPNSGIEKRMKEITLSLNSYSKYMNTYTKLTQTYSYKSPNVLFYPLTKNEKYLPISHKRNFSSKPGRPKNFKITSNLYVPVVTESGTQENKVTKKGKNSSNFLNLLNNNNYNSIFFKDEILFEYFIEGYFLREPKILKILNLEDTPLTYQPIMQKDVNYFNKYLVTLSKNKNYDYTNEKEFTYKLPNNMSEVNFKLIINNIYLRFIDVRTKKKYKKFLPFRYMILFYLLDYSMLKELFSEIFYYNKKVNEFQVNKETVDDVIEKYSLFISNKLNNFENLDSYNMIYKENELLYNTNYTWVLNDDGDYKINEVKIVFPRIKFIVTNINLKFVKSMNKYLLINIIKNNFLQWDKYLLYELFMTKKFRKMIDELIFIGEKKTNITTFKNRKFYLSKFKNNSTFTNKQTLEFYITQINCQSSKYFNFVPNSITINYSKRVNLYSDQTDENKIKCEKIQLTLKESQNLYKLSQNWGTLNTIKKCMNYNNMTQRYSFNFDILDNISNDVITAIQIDKSFEKNNTVNKLPYKFKINQVGFLVQDCFLSQKILIDQNKMQINYRQIPKKLSEYILSNKKNNNNDEFNNIIGECSSDIIKEKILSNLTEEINCKGEFKKPLYDGRHKSREGTTILLPGSSNSGTLKLTNEPTAINNISSKKTFQLNLFSSKKLNNDHEIEKIPEKIIEETKTFPNRKEEKNKLKKKLSNFKSNFKSYSKRKYKEKPLWLNLDKIAQNSTKFTIPIRSKNELSRQRMLRNVNKYYTNSLGEIDKLKKGLMSNK